jgi:hypothetical protein
VRWDNVLMVHLNSPGSETSQFRCAIPPTDQIKTRQTERYKFSGGRFPHAYSAHLHIWWTRIPDIAAGKVFVKFGIECSPMTSRLQIGAASVRRRLGSSSDKSLVPVPRYLGYQGPKHNGLQELTRGLGLAQRPIRGVETVTSNCGGRPRVQPSRPHSECRSPGAPTRYHTSFTVEDAIRRRGCALLYRLPRHKSSLSKSRYQL